MWMLFPEFVTSQESYIQHAVRMKEYSTFVQCRAGDRHTCMASRGNGVVGATAWGLILALFLFGPGIMEARGHDNITFGRNYFVTGLIACIIRYLIVSDFLSPTSTNCYYVTTVPSAFCP